MGVVIETLKLRTTLIILTDKLVGFFMLYSKCCNSVERQTHCSSVEPFVSTCCNSVERGAYCSSVEPSLQRELIMVSLYAFPF